MSRPSFQFYPADWRADIHLRRCSAAARGVWMDILCALHDSKVYGVLHWPLKELARAVGAPISLVRELVEKGVLRGADEGIAEAYVYVPRSGRVNGQPVVLVPVQEGPVWYCGRMVKDEYVRENRGAGSRFTAAEEPSSPKPPMGEAMGDSMGEGKSDGSSISSPSSPSSSKRIPPNPRPAGGMGRQEDPVGETKPPVKEPPPDETPVGPYAAERAVLPRRAGRLRQAEKKRTRVCRNTPLMIRIGSWFDKPPTALWSIAELEALLQLAPEEPQIAGMEAYYTTEMGAGKDYRRRDLATLLNNWHSELDRARGHFRERSVAHG